MENNLKSINEIHIFDTLSHLSDCKVAADKLFKNFHHKENKLTDKLSTLHFLMNSGHTNIVFSLLREWPNKEKYFPWSVFIECLNKKNLKLTDDEFTALDNFLKINNIDLPLLKKHELINHQFKQRVREYDQYLQYDSQQSVKLLWDKLNFIKDRDLIEQEGEILTQLKLYDSNNPELEDHLARYTKKQALNVILKKNKDTIQTDFETYSQNHLSKEEIKFCLNLFDTTVEKYNDIDNKFYDFSILFYQMGAYDFALKCLEKCTPSSNTQWIKIELLFLNNRFFECIQMCNNMFLQHSDNPDMQFASLYQKSQALWKIGSHDEAIEIMKSILKIRADYRSAYEILLSWKENH